MTALPRGEWLHLARGLAIGSSQRYPHPGDRTQRPNLIVSNHHDRWGAYCVSCKRGGVLFKEHVRPAYVHPTVSADLSIPTDLIQIAAPGTPEFVNNTVGRYLALKGMDLHHFPGAVWYSESRGRILVHEDGAGWLGRDITDKSNQKWLTYNRATQLGTVHPGDSVVICEDPFSYFKLQWAVGHVHKIVCSLGTRPAASLMLELVQAMSVLVFYDGDIAGYTGAKALERRLKPYGVPAVAACAPQDKDPKDMGSQQIHQHLGRFSGLSYIEGAQ